MNNAAFTLSLKQMGFNIKPNTKKDLKIDVFGDWNRNNKKYAFVIVNSFSDKLLKEVEFSNAVNFCKNNHYKLIIISKKNINKITQVDYKVINHKELKKLLNDYNRAYIETI